MCYLKLIKRTKAHVRHQINMKRHVCPPPCPFSTSSRAPRLLVLDIRQTRRIQRRCRKV